MTTDAAPALPSLRVTAVRAKEVLGARDLRLEPGKVTLLSGWNASGKSSALAAVQAALGGGSLAKLAHVGAEDPPEVVLVIDSSNGGPERYLVEKTGADTVRVRARVGDSAAFEDVPRPQAWLSSLFDPNACNPIRFMRAADKDRTVLLLEALPLTLDRTRLAEILGTIADVANELRPIPEGLHALEELALLREEVFRTRTGVNRDQDGKAKAADQTRRATLASIPEDPVAELGAVQAKVEELAGALAAGQEKAEADEKAARAAATTARKAEEAEVHASHEAAVADLSSGLWRADAEAQAELDRQIAALQAAHDSAKAERAKANAHRVAVQTEAREGALGVIRATETAALAAAALAGKVALSALAETNAELVSSRVRLAALQERSKSAHKARALHEQAAAFDREAEDLAAKAERLTNAIDALDDYRRSLAENLPIPGLEVKGKSILVGGVPYDQLNTAEQIRIAVEVTCLRAKGRRLPVVFVDGAEALDTPHFTIFCEALAKHDIQAFIGRVTDADFAPSVLA